MNLHFTILSTSFDSKLQLQGRGNPQSLATESSYRFYIEGGVNPA